MTKLTLVTSEPEEEMEIIPFYEDFRFEEEKESVKLTDQEKIDKILDMKARIRFYLEEIEMFGRIK